MKHGSILLLVGGALSVIALPVFAQTNDEKKSITYGGRVKESRQALNNVAADGRRVSVRINTRIDSRLSMRIDRFASSQKDEKSAYTPQIDDGTKTKILP